MKKLGFLLLAFFLCFPFVGSAQNVETEDFDSLVAKFNAECPITSGENWALASFAIAGDTVLIERHRQREAPVGKGTEQLR